MVRPFFEAALKQVLGTTPKVRQVSAVGGGCINSCFRIETDNLDYFIKYHTVPYLDMFEKEYQGLQALAAHQYLTIPTALGYGTAADRSFLLMEYLRSGLTSNNYWEQLGRGLAALHRVSGARYGWQTNNYIGRLQQANYWHEDWITFFIEERLNPQIKGALDAGLLPLAAHEQFKSLCNKLNELLPVESPALLHGDLWSGNVLVGPQGEPCLVDPAVYYGHREIELAFTTLFGGFDEKFYLAYENDYLLIPGYRQRFEIYNLYPLLVHLNLFGRGYLRNIQSTLDRFS